MWISSDAILNTIRIIYSSVMLCLLCSFSLSFAFWSWRSTLYLQFAYRNYITLQLNLILFYFRHPQRHCPELLFFSTDSSRSWRGVILLRDLLLELDFILRISRTVNTAGPTIPSSLSQARILVMKKINKETPGVSNQPGDEF